MAQLRSEAPRKSGLGFIGDVPWGTHLCQFYQTKEDLIDILVPYFRAGLENNEFCMWITSSPLDAKQAKEALKKAVPALDDYVKKGQIEIMPYTKWYLLNGKFDSDRVLQGWVEKEKGAFSRGFDGLRLTGNTLWVERSLWKRFTDYEAAINAVITSHRIIALCTYSLKKCTGTDMVDVLKNHVGTLIRKETDWYLVEDVAHRKETEEELAESELQYHSLFANMNSAFAYHKIVLDDDRKPVDYVFLEVNDDFEKLTGLRREDILGKRVTEVLPGIEKDPADWIGTYGKVASTGEAVRFENYSQNLKKWYSVSAYRPSKGYFAVAFDDITERKQAEFALLESERRWATTLSSIGDAVIATDLDGKVTFMNAVAEALTGWTLKEASQKLLKEVFKIINEQTRKQVEDPIAKVFEKGVVVGLANHTILVRKDGTEVAIDDSGAPIRDENGKVVGVVLVFRDITERKKFEQALISAKTEWERTFDSVPDLIAILDDKHKIVRANRAMAQRLGVTSERCIGLNCYECVHGTSIPPEFCPHTKTLQDGKEHIAEVHEDRLGGDFLVSTTPLRDEQGQMIGSVHVARDITQRKRIENELRETRDYLENLLNYANAPIIVWDPDFRITKFNHAFERLTGLSSDDVVGKNLDILFPIDRKEESIAHIKRTLEGEYWETVEIPVLHVDGTVKTLLWNSANIYDWSGKEIVATIAQGHNITERKKALEALHESQRDLNRAQAVAKTGSWRLDVQRNILLWSDETYRMFGIPKGKPLTYDTFLGIVHPNDRNYVDQKWQVALRGEPYDIEHRIIVNGEVRWVREKAELEFDKDNVLKSGFGTVQDITERKKAEQEIVDTLEASHHRQAEISALLEAAKAVLVHHRFSKAAQSIFGSCKELLGATAGYVALLSRNEMENEVLFLDSGSLPCTVDPSLPMPIRGLRAEAYRTGKVVHCNDFPSSEWSGLMPKGHVVLKNVLFAPLTIDNKTVGIMGLANKPSVFTERDAQMASAFGEIASIALINSQMLEKLEENEKLLKAHSERLEEMVEEKTKQLKNAERLSAIGETAGMVGHDIRNPLQAIIGELYLAKGELASLPDGDAKESLKESVKAVEEQVTYINKIVTDLQDYAKPLAPCFEDTDLKKIIESVLLTIKVPEAVEVVYSVEDDFPKLMIDPAYMRRILTNLISNAVQAMPNGGKITIHAYCKDNRAFVKVEDTGEGITEEAKDKIFKPLFTTKAKGQGFGLAVVKKLTEALNGTITFESELGKGTKFTIELPLKV
jgi:PAS domain S-box-containing protein